MMMMLLIIVGVWIAGPLTLKVFHVSSVLKFMPSEKSPDLVRFLWVLIIKKCFD